MNKQKFEEYTKNLNLKQVHTGSIWTEGPCYLKHLNKIIWSDSPNNRMLGFDFNKTEIFRSPSNFCLFINYYSHSLCLKKRGYL